jgi:Domain of unknown function (DUF427)
MEACHAGLSCRPIMQAYHAGLSCRPAFSHGYLNPPYRPESHLNNMTTTTTCLNGIAASLAKTAPRTQPALRRVRVLFNHKIIADTQSPYFVWEQKDFPQYYLPAKDVQTKFIEKVSKAEAGEAEIGRLVVGDHSDEVLWFLTGALAGLIRFEFKNMGMTLGRCR